LITVVIPTLNSEAGLPATMTALVPAVVEGLVRQVIVVDGGSRDRTVDIADHAGAEIVVLAGGLRGAQLAEGARLARQPWILFLHSDSVLDDGWTREAAAFIDRVESGERPLAAGAFRFTLDDLGMKPRLLEAGVSLRCALFRLPYGDQGLLIPARLYNEIGGFRPMPLMEDVDIIRRLGRRRTVIFRTPIVTSAIRYKRDGYAARVLRNLCCFTLYQLGVPLKTIQRIYG
jgi:rSAM/selenodomain-associated transferase 2